MDSSSLGDLASRKISSSQFPQHHPVFIPIRSDIAKVHVRIPHRQSSTQYRQAQRFHPSLSCEGTMKAFLTLPPLCTAAAAAVLSKPGQVDSETESRIKQTSEQGTTPGNIVDIAKEMASDTGANFLTYHFIGFKNIS